MDPNYSNLERKTLSKYVKILMIIAGMWRSNSTFLTKNIYDWYSRFIEGTNIIFIGVIAVKLFQFIMVGSELDLIFENMAILVPGTGTLIKMFICKKNNIFEIFQNMLIEEEEICSSVDIEIKSTYFKRIESCNQLNLVISLDTFSGVIIFFLMSCIKAIVTNMSEQTDHGTLEGLFIYHFWMPFEERDYVLVTVILNVLFAFVSSVLYNVYQILLFTILSFLASKYELLYLQISRLGNEENGNPFLDLKRVVSNHILLIRFTENMNDAVRYMVFFDSLLNAVSVACVAIQLRTVDSFSKVIFSIFFLFGLMLRVFALGWLANEIKLKSLAIADILYQTKWYDFEKRCKSVLQIMLLRSQTPLTMSIGSFGPMTTGTVLTTMQAAYSYVTFMNNYN